MSTNTLLILLVLGVLSILIVVIVVEARNRRKKTGYFPDVTGEDLKLKKGDRFSLSKDKGRIEPGSGDLTNGKMPIFLLSPMRVYVPVFVGVLALVAFLYTFLQ